MVHLQNRNQKNANHFLQIDRLVRDMDPMCSCRDGSVVCDDPRFQVGRLTRMISQEQLSLSIYRLRGGFVFGVRSERTQLLGEEGAELVV